MGTTSRGGLSLEGITSRKTYCRALAIHFDITLKAFKSGRDSLAVGKGKYKNGWKKIALDFSCFFHGKPTQGTESHRRESGADGGPIWVTTMTPLVSEENFKGGREARKRKEEADRGKKIFLKNRSRGIVRTGD